MDEVVVHVCNIRCFVPVSDGFQSVVTMTKLSNVNTAARYEVEGYTGPFLPDVLSNGDAKVIQGLLLLVHCVHYIL